MGLTYEQLRHHAEALLDVWVGPGRLYRGCRTPKFKALWWQGLDRLDRTLDELLPTLDPEWAVTEHIQYRVRPEEVPYGPAEWTDPPEPPPPRPGRKPRLVGAGRAA